MNASLRILSALCLGLLPAIAQTPANPAEAPDSSLRGRWAPLSDRGLSGTDGTILAIAQRKGILYVGGIFGGAGAGPARNIASWDGARWRSLGEGIAGTVRALAIDRAGNLIAGGEFRQAGGARVANIARWNGAAWEPLGEGLDGIVRALVVDSANRLFAGGDFTKSGAAVTGHVAQWTGQTWKSVGGGLGTDSADSVFSLLADHCGTIYVGGRFEVPAGGKTLFSVATWDGKAWGDLAGGVRGTVRALTMDTTGSVYAGGTFEASGIVNLARWDGMTWNHVRGAYEYGIPSHRPVWTMAWTRTGNQIIEEGPASIPGPYFTSPSRAVPQIWFALSTGETGEICQGGRTTENSFGNIEGCRISFSLPATNGEIRHIEFDERTGWHVAGWFGKLDGIENPGTLRWDGTRWVPRPPGPHWGRNMPARGPDGGRWGDSSTLPYGPTDTMCPPLSLPEDFNPVALVFGRGCQVAAAGRPDEWSSAPRVFHLDSSNRWVRLGQLHRSTRLDALAGEPGGRLYAGGSLVWVRSRDTTRATFAEWRQGRWEPRGDLTGEVRFLVGDVHSGIYAGGDFRSPRDSSQRGVAFWNGKEWLPLGKGIEGAVRGLRLFRGRLYVWGKLLQPGERQPAGLLAWDGKNWFRPGTELAGMDVTGLGIDPEGNILAGGWYRLDGVDHPIHGLLRCPGCAADPTSATPRR